MHAATKARSCQSTHSVSHPLAWRDHAHAGRGRGGGASSGEVGTFPISCAFHSYCFRPCTHVLQCRPVEVACSFPHVIHARAAVVCYTQHTQHTQRPASSPLQPEGQGLGSLCCMHWHLSCATQCKVAAMSSNANLCCVPFIGACANACACVSQCQAASNLHVALRPHALIHSPHWLVVPPRSDHRLRSWLSAISINGCVWVPAAHKFAAFQSLYPAVVHTA